MNRTILIVDDSKTERVILDGYLKTEYDIIEAASGEEAIEILHTQWQIVSAILMDIVMPGMDGFETLKAIKTNVQWLPIPVVITTGLDDEDSREKAIALGADNFVIKPFNRQLLLHVVSNAVQLREMAAMANEIMRDRLTGLLSRDTFFAEAERMIRRHEPAYYTLACMDIENFKVINDQYGTETGDKVLRHIAQTLNGFVSGIRGLCGRYMADKFAVLFPTAMKDSQAVADNHAKVMAPKCVPLPLRIRIGRYLVDDTSILVSAMFDRAFMAEEMVKGRFDTYICEYNEKMLDDLLREQQITSDMAGALQRGEFEPWFQPQYNHATGALIGAEALVRWRRDGKIVPPNEFIPVFEKNGFIYEVDKSVWRQVCAYLRRWLDEGKKPLPVSVNISRSDLYQADFMETICGLVKEYGLPTELLRLEITESAFAENTNVITGIAGKLIAEGFTIEIDDFGSGYSSLNTLKDVPAAILKLDMRFFESTTNSLRAGNIIESVVRMAKWLGMAVIAEGVEDKQQADYLKTIGCYYIQGYYYARPMPADSYESELKKSTGEAKLSRLETLETLDSNLFWDPKSMETLIFNSYAGGACIFEAHNNTSELLRVNDQYVGEMHGLVPIDAQLKDSSLTAFIDKEEWEILSNTLLTAKKTGRAASCRLRLTDGKQVEYIRFTARLIAQTNERRLYYAVIVNITEQRKAEQKRLEAAKQLQVIMGNVNGSVAAFVMDEAGNTTPIFCNEKYYEIYGYTKEQAETIQLDVMSCIVPEDFAEVINKLNKLKKDGVPIDIDFRARKRDGSTIFVRCIASRMSMDGYGDQVIVAVETDCTEQYRMQDQLRAIVENINGGVAVVHLRGDRPEFLLVNEEYFEIIGYTREQFYAEIVSAFDVVHPDDRERIEKLYKDAAAEQKRYTMEYRIVRRNGAIRHILCNTTVMKLIGVEEPVQLSVVNDITMLREAQHKERIVTSQMRAVMNAMTSGVTALAIQGEQAEFLFANDRYYEMHGIIKREDGQLNLAAALAAIYPEDRAHVSELILSTTEAGQTAETELRVQLPDGVVRWEKAVINVTRIFGLTVPVQVTIFTDITEEKAATDKLCFLNETARDIIAQPDVETAVSDTLARINGYFAADRTYIVELDRTRQVSSNTYEVCAVGVKPQKARLQEQPFTAEDFWFEVLNSQGYLIIESRDTLDEQQVELHKLLLGQNIHSLIIVALRQNGKLIGFVGADNPANAIEQVKQLTGVADNLSMLLLRRDMLRKIAHDNSVMQTLMSDTPGGFLRMQIFDDKNPDIISFNAGFCKMLGMTGDEVTAAYGDDAYQLFSAEDIAATSVETAEAFAAGGQYSTKYRLKKKDGDFIWVQVFGRFVKGEDGALFLNSYFTDIAEQKKAEQHQIELLDNLPVGAALYEYNGKDVKDKDLRYICVSPSIGDMAGIKNLRDFIGKTAAEIFSDTFADKFNEDDRRVLESGKSVMNTLEHLPLADGSFCLARTSKFPILDASGRAIGVYCVSRDITAQREKEPQMKLLFNNIPGGIATFLCRPGKIENVNVVLTDVTAQQEEKERLRLSNEEYRIAILHANRTISRYNIAAQTMAISADAAKRLELPEQICGVPYERVKLGKISEETKDAYIAFFEGIMRGKKESTVIYCKLLPVGWRWIEASATTIFNAEGKPFSAIISYIDVTEQREKEAIYSHWQNSIAERPKDGFTLLRCNLSKNKTFDSREGDLLTIDFERYANSLDERTEAYIGQCVYADDRERFRAFLRTDTMLAEYYRGHSTDFIEFREYLTDGKTRWLRLSVDLVKYKDSSDVQAYLMFENIDEQKRAQQKIIERAETDSLTGLLNRATFAVRANQIMSESKSDTVHALLMLDIDGFKLVNDLFGHGAGDQRLIEIADILTRFSRQEDLVGRLGGDEFMLFITDITNETTVAKKARQLCELIRKNLGLDVRISASIGIAMFPQDGEGFEKLYKVADNLLYRVKDSGKNGYAFTNEDPVLDADSPRQPQLQKGVLRSRSRRRRMLIADDNMMDLELLSGLFRQEYRIEKATDGAVALMKLRHYGTAISVVLLDLNMPRMDGFEVLRKMKQDEATRTIPVIVVSADEDLKTALAVIRAGADDLVVKPVDPYMLRIRVESAISRSENERTRAQNSYMAMRNAEVSGYKSALERSGIMVISLDWGKNQFVYSPSVSQRLIGEYDGKVFWRELLSKMVTDSQTVQKMQQLVHKIAMDRERSEGNMVVKLKTVSGTFSLFEMNVFKETNEFGLADKLIITLREMSLTQQENGQTGEQHDA